jgi:hypothetical protein
MIIIGSRALKHWYPTEVREPKDYDIVGTYQELCDYVHQNYKDIKSCQLSSEGKYFIRFYKGPSVEFEHTQHKNDSQNHLITLSKRGAPLIIFPERNLTVHVAFPFALLAVKKSHLSVPLKQWEKHILDYHLLKAKLSGQSIPAFFDTIYSNRLQETQNRGHISTAKLCMTNDEFFDKSEPLIKRYFVHDDIHNIVAYHNKPLFNRIKRDPRQASCDKGLFEALSYEDQLNAISEEAFVIALERKIIPNIMNKQPFDAHNALKYSLQRICTTLTSGWFREYAQEHYMELLYNSVDYVGKFVEANKKGLLRSKVNI